MKIASTAFILTVFVHAHHTTCTEIPISNTRNPKKENQLAVDMLNQRRECRPESGMSNLRKENKINAESAAGVWKTERTQNTAGGTISDTKKKF